MAFLLRIILLVLFIYILASPVVTLQCYYCSDTGGDSKCQDANRYVNAFDEEESTVLRNCSAGSDNICFIETYKSALGVAVSEIRDCGDGGTFSFTGSTEDQKNRYALLKNLSTNNRTKCIFDGLHMVCLSKCVTDFCNGPQVVNFATNLKPAWCFASLIILIKAGTYWI